MEDGASSIIPPVLCETYPASSSTIPSQIAPVGIAGQSAASVVTIALFAAVT